MRVLDVMTRNPVTVEPKDSLHHAAQLMIENKVSGLPVVEGERLVGVLTEADFLRLRAAGKGRRWLDSLMGRPDPLDRASQVRDAMTPSPVTIAGDRSVADAARLMLDAGVKRLIVVDERGGLRGIVSRADVLRSYVRTDGAIAREVTVALRHYVVDGVEVSVNEGVVTLSGTVSLRSGAELAEDLVRRIDGVISVDNHITWEADELAI